MLEDYDEGGEEVIESLIRTKEEFKTILEKYDEGIKVLLFEPTSGNYYDGDEEIEIYLELKRDNRFTNSSKELWSKLECTHYAKTKRENANEIKNHDLVKEFKIKSFIYKYSIIKNLPLPVDCIKLISSNLWREEVL